MQLAKEEADWAVVLLTALVPLILIGGLLLAQWSWRTWIRWHTGTSSRAGNDRTS